ncbi:nicotinamide mononucleotide transporter PnuC [Kitasatospora sp. MMS16-BH015]|uniref:nicotinamide riboside transporter PnuC n=1 Tax=Kitasatospora sp. MMS16-BH015 TaxID=2018025 RepID=UPI000CA189A0|nr:nicotinamide riboside transporter PnuC [Kitasatospora sp. MMS16-BH015]AUG80551.1 nicotinamide mononucleotide transporter PnuC [Kitasatospora sp. MMS16-BH015]
MAVADTLSGLLAPLDHQLFLLGQDAVTAAELLGFATGAVCVWLCVRASAWNFPVGIANNLFFLVLFWGARLYAGAALQVVFLLLAAHGWYRWLRGGAGRAERAMGRATPAGLVVVTGLVVPATAVLTVVLGRAGDSAPFWDALTTALSLAAQWLLNAKQVENWYFWIAADLVYIPLYAAKSLVLTAVVYVLFLAMCGVGLRSWYRAMAGNSRAVVAA